MGLKSTKELIKFIEERNIQNKIDFHTNNISLLEDKLKQLDAEEKESNETIIIMDKFLNQIKLGKHGLRLQKV